MKRVFTLLFILSAGMAVSCKQTDILSSMSVEDKAKVVIGCEFEGRPDHGVGASLAIEEYGIPHFKFADGPAGLRLTAVRKGDDKTYYCTAFPTSSSLATSWNTELAREVGEAMGNETLEYGIDAILAPAMNIQRNPLCGRNFEYYSEDPLITGKMAAAVVNGIQSQGVGTSVKHFIANNQETHRKFVNSVISQRALREIYLRGFEIAIKEAKPWTIMTAYNKVNGYYCPENKELIRDLLRKEWGYDGLVITDWMDGEDAVAQMRAGVNLIMPGLPNPLASYFYDEIVAGVKDGVLSEAVLDENVKKVLENAKRSSRNKGYACSMAPDLDAHSQVSLSAARESMVLLKNEASALPLGADVKSVALFGKASYDYIAGGRGSGEVNFEKNTSFDEAFRSSGYAVDEKVSSFYAGRMNDVLNGEGNIAAKIKQGHPGLPKDRVRKYLVASADEFSVPLGVILDASASADMALITISRVSAESVDSPEIGYFTLNDAEMAMIRDVCREFHAKGKKVAVLLNIGAVIETAPWKDLPDAILLCGQAGQRGGQATIEILAGKVNPSGKLVSSFPVKYQDVPSAAEFPGIPADNPVNSFYSEGVYVGYRYYSSFGVPVSYPFGYGLSYTQFEYSSLRLSASEFKGKIKAVFTVTNTGKVPGKEIAELYLSAPEETMDKPSFELKGFAKTKELAPGESQTLEITLDGRALSSFSGGRSCWIADAGEYKVMIGASSDDIRLEDTFVLKKTTVIEKTGDILYPNMSVKDIGSASDSVLGDRNPFRKDLFKLDFMWRKPVIR